MDADALTVPILVAVPTCPAVPGPTPPPLLLSTPLDAYMLASDASDAQRLVRWRHLRLDTASHDLLPSKSLAGVCSRRMVGQGMCLVCKGYITVLGGNAPILFTLHYSPSLSLSRLVMRHIYLLLVRHEITRLLLLTEEITLPCALPACLAVDSRGVVSRVTAVLATVV